MNEAIERIKREAAKQLPPNHAYRPQFYNGMETDSDEKQVRDLLNEQGWGEFKVTSDTNKYERWDLEGTDKFDRTARIEVKSRTPNDYTSWIIDTYKVDWMLNEFPFDTNYYVNVCNGAFHVYDMNYIKSCYVKKNVRSRMHNGTYELRNFYMFEKRMFMIELSTGELGAGSLMNDSFGKLEQ